MEVLEPPNPIEEPNLLFKLQTKRLLFQESRFTNRGYNLVTTSSKYGFVFVGFPEACFSVYYLHDIINTECVNPPHLSLPLQERPTHLSVSCDGELLAVCTEYNVHIYRVHDLQNENVTSISKRLNETSGKHVTALQWNPCITEMLAIVYENGPIIVAQLQSNTIVVKQAQGKAFCLSWSPKGKQFVTGNTDGTFTQYKPDLTPVKSINPPNLAPNMSLEVLAIHWVSNYQFAPVYRIAADNSRPYVTIVNAAKGFNPNCLNYEDICYSMNSTRPWYYFLQSVPQWGLIIAASSNSMEIATLACTDNVNWMQWFQGEDSKPELPMIKQQDSYPIGIAFDTSAITQLPWGENETLPHMPHLLALTHTGLLVTFAVINVRPGAPQLCAPPQVLSLPAHRLIEDSPASETVSQHATPSANATSAPNQAFSSESSQPVQPQPPVAASVAPVSNTNTFGQQSSLFSNLSSPVQPSVPASVASAQPNNAFGQQTSQFANLGQPKPTLAQSHAHPSAPPPSYPDTTPTERESDSDAKAAMDHQRNEELKAAAAKADEDMRAMLLKEVNSFQSELYRFKQQYRDISTKMDMTPAIEVGLKLQNMNAEQIKKDCSMESLSAAILELRLEMAKAYALLAETRGQRSDTANLRQVEPLCARTVESVRRHACALRSQLEAAERVVKQQWGEVYSSAAKSGDRMKLPALDQVYQPLVRHQEILNRQRALLKNLMSALHQANDGGTRRCLLKGLTEDPLSKLTKNVLNMSMNSKSEQPKKSALSAAKLEALRERLFNHKTVRVKPVTFEVQRHIANMQDTHDRLLAEMRELKIKQQQYKSEQKEPVTPFAVPARTHRQEKPPQQPPEISKPTKPQPTLAKPPPQAVIMEGPPPSQLSTLQWMKTPDADDKNSPLILETKQSPLNWLKPSEQVLNWAKDLKSSESSKSVTITPLNIASVAKTLFKNDGQEESEDKKPTINIRADVISTPGKLQPPASDSTLKSLLEGKSSLPAVPKEDFFGQKICSPSTPVSTTSNKALPFGGGAFTAPTTSAFGSFTSLASQDSKPFNFGQTKAMPGSEPNAQSQETGEDQKQDSGKESSLFSNMSFGKGDSAPSTIFSEKASETKSVEKSDTPTLKPDAKSAISAQTVNKPSESGGDKAGIIFGGTSVSKPTTPASTATSVFASSASTTAVTTTDTIFGKSTTVPAPTTAADASASTPEVAATFATSAPASTATSATLTMFGKPSATITPTPAAAAPAAIASSTVAATSAGGANLQAASAAAAAAIAAASAATGEASISPPALLPSAPAAPDTPSTASIFGSATTAVTTTAPPSVFASASPSIFGTPTSTPGTSIFSTPTSSAPGSPAPAAPTPSAPGSPAPAAPASPASVFGQPAFGTQTPPKSFFGSPSAGSVFGGANAQSSPQPSFGATASRAAPVFGSTPPSTNASVFGSPATSSASVFGSPATSTASVFGSPATSNASVFGSSSVTAPGSIFGGAAAATPGSVFGGGAATPGNVFGGGGSVFGGQTAPFGSPTTSPGSVFGAAPASSASVFGGAPSKSASVFGGSPSTPAFGANEAANMFGSTNIGGAAPQTQSTANVFGGGTVFGGNGASNVFGSKPAFGQSSPSSVFGGSPGFGQKPAFGSGGGFGSSFASPTTQSSSVFGGGGGFGSPTQTAAFGAAPAFGTPQQQQGSAFGGGAVFGSKPAFGQSPAFGGGGGGAFSGGGGFGSTSPGGGSAFGAPAAFGGNGAGAFGSAPAFGGSPGFAGASPGKLFGASSPGFGGGGGGSSTFENLAKQNTVSFGNLAQQSQQPAPSFNTSPSFSGWRG